MYNDNLQKYVHLQIICTIVQNMEWEKKYCINVKIV